MEELRLAMTERGMKLILDITPNHIGFIHPWYLAAKDNPNRETSDALKHGGFQHLHAAGELVAFQCQSRAEQMIVLASRGAENVPQASLDMVMANLPDGSILRDLLTDYRYEVADGAPVISGLSHGQAMFLRVE